MEHYPTRLIERHAERHREVVDERGTEAGGVGQGLREAVVEEHMESTTRRRVVQNTRLVYEADGEC